MDNLSPVTPIVKGNNSKKSYCIVTGNRLLHGISRLQLEKLQHRIELFRAKEKTARKRMKEDRKDFWFSIEMNMNLGETSDDLKTHYYIFSSAGKIQGITYSQVKALSDALHTFLKDNTQRLRLRHIDNSTWIHEQRENFLIEIREDELTGKHGNLLDNNIDVSKEINHGCWDVKPTFYYTLYINGQGSNKLSPPEFERFEKILADFLRENK
ncbi:MAG TPA: hypothetical protein H9796_02180 [Candidatus Butyricimonas faecavium]|nr:hypothetical protein [Candidatus Butyricimonas faecavium]